MKLAILYSIFDGEELLEGSIKQIREHVDCVIAISQVVSNYGNEYEGGYELAKSLPEIDFNFIFYPDLNKTGLQNETLKRNLLIEKAKEQECTHFIFIDVDEYYEPLNFFCAKEKIKDLKPDVTYCNLFTYYKKPIYRLTPMETYYVPFICPLNKFTRVGNFPAEVLCDPTRNVNNYKTPYIFKPDELTMHHFSYVRNNIALKLNNSSAKGNFKNIPELVNKFISYQKGEDLINFANYDVVEVPNLFNIKGFD